jgi:hypothetical protein
MSVEGKFGGVDNRQGMGAPPLLGLTGPPKLAMNSRGNDEDLTVLTSDDGLGDTGRKTGSRLEGFAVQRMRDCSYSEAVNEAVVGRGHGLRSGFLPGRTRSSMGSCRGSPVDRLDRNDIRGRKTRRKNQPCSPYVRYALTPDGTPFVIGKSVTGFSNSEKGAVGLTHVVPPFLVEDSLTENDGDHSKRRNWGIVCGGPWALITRQNPASSQPAAHALVSILSCLVEPGTFALVEGEGARVRIEREWLRRAEPPAFVSSTA